MGDWGCRAGDDPSLQSTFPPPFSACQSLGQPSEDRIEQAGEKKARARHEGTRDKRDRSTLFLLKVTPSLAVNFIITVPICPGIKFINL